MTIVDIVAVLFTAYITVDMARYLREKRLKVDFSVFRTLKKWKWVLPVLTLPLLIVVTLAIALLTLEYGGPVLRFSWLALLQPPGQPDQAQNLMVAGLRIPWFVWVFLPLFALNVPRLAMREERVFRQGVRTWPAAVLNSFKFGLVHCLVGVPLGVGLALAVPGAVFALVYAKGGVRLSTAWHSVYNYFILLVAGAYFAWPTIAGR